MTKIGDAGQANNVNFEQFSNYFSTNAPKTSDNQSFLPQGSYLEKVGFNQSDLVRANLEAKAVSPLSAASEERLSHVDPQVAVRVRAMAADLKAQGINVVVASGYRSIAEQNALYAQGRTKGGGIVTNAPGGYSFHNYGLAVDVVPLDSKGQPNWNLGKAIWDKIGAAGKKQGLEWGDRGYTDLPHFQLRAGNTPQQLLAEFKRNGGSLQKIWDDVNKHYPNVGSTTPTNPNPNNGTRIQGLPNYSQADPRWGGDRYFTGSGTMANSGCTVTAAAIAASWATGKTVTPKEANQNYGATLGKFESQDLSPNGGTKFGNTFNAISKNSTQAGALLDRVRTSVKSAHPVVLGISGNVRTPDGKTWSRHTVVATGVDKNGQILVNDPATGKTQPLSAFKFDNFDMAEKISKKGGAGGTIEGNPNVGGSKNPPSSTPVSTNLKQGSRGAAVKDLQQNLAKLGYKLAADGIFGPKTDAAVRRFQADKNLVADGIVGPKTRSAIDKVLHADAPKAAVPTAQLKRGAQGEQVKQLQDALFKLGYKQLDPAKIGRGHGTFGPITERCVRDFQSKHNLVADGIYGPKTQAALRQALGKSDGGKPAPTPTNPTKPTNLPTGNSGVNFDKIENVKNNPNVTAEFKREVVAMARRLGTRPEYLMSVMSFESGLNPKTVNGTSGATGLIQFLPGTARGLGTTTDALRGMSSVEQLKYVEKYFQSYKGKLGTLEGVYTSVLSGTAHPNPKDVLFRRGTSAYSQNSALDFNKNGEITSGEATSAVASRMFGGVRAVQQRLKDLGFDPHGVDGQFGANTSRAIADFQRSRRLPATGLLDEATGKALG